MDKAFEKILDRLEDELTSAKTKCGTNVDFDKGICKSQEIVQQVAKEYNVGWISVKDRLPDKAGSYLVIGKSGGATVTRWYMPSEFYTEGHFGGNGADYIRYWMPRPEPPKERD